MANQGTKKALVWTAWALLMFSVVGISSGVFQLLAAGDEERKAGEYHAFANRTEDLGKMTAYLQIKEKHRDAALGHYRWAALGGVAGMTLLLSAIGLLARDKSRRIEELLKLTDRLAAQDAIAASGGQIPVVAEASTQEAPASEPAAEPTPEPAPEEDVAAAPDAPDDEDGKSTPA
jgi:uncharacterized membrane protein YeiB